MVKFDLSLTKFRFLTKFFILNLAKKTKNRILPRLNYVAYNKYSMHQAKLQAAQFSISGLWLNFWLKFRFLSKILIFSLKFQFLAKISIFV